MSIKRRGYTKSERKCHKHFLLDIYIYKVNAHEWWTRNKLRGKLNMKRIRFSGGKKIAKSA